MSFYNYDAWKLSNPIDDGFYYEEEETSPIDDPHFYKYKVGRTQFSQGAWVYGVILTTGKHLEIWNFRDFPNIQVELHEFDEIMKAIDRVEKAHDEFEWIDEDEFIPQYKKAIKDLNSAIQHDARL